MNNNISISHSCELPSILRAGCCHEEGVISLLTYCRERRHDNCSDVPLIEESRQQQRSSATVDADMGAHVLSWEKGITHQLVPLYYVEPH